MQENGKEKGGMGTKTPQQHREAPPGKNQKSRGKGNKKREEENEIFQDWPWPTALVWCPSTPRWAPVCPSKSAFWHRWGPHSCKYWWAPSTWGNPPLEKRENEESGKKNWGENTGKELLKQVPAAGSALKMKLEMKAQIWRPKSEMSVFRGKSLRENASFRLKNLRENVRFTVKNLREDIRFRVKNLKENESFKVKTQKSSNHPPRQTF